MFFTRDKSFYKTLVTLAIPIALQNAVTFAVGLADNVMIGTLGALEQELEHINEICWLAKEETILSWTETEGYPAKTLKDVETGTEDGKKETYSTESLAKFAFSIFWRAMKFAKENRTPVLFDY